MDLEVVGRHALLFDDDAAAAFVNSGDALVGWNSLSIDRYDVRHLLSAPPPPRKRRPHSPPGGSSAEAEIDRERYLDLQAAIEEEESDVGEKLVEAGGYHSVAFSYGNTGDSNSRKSCGDEMGDSGFRPPFHIPESLLQCLPPTEKVHQIIARTALFVAKNGGQSEIVLRVKQGDNPTFGFLMPDHHLHPYFQYLIDHQELLKSDTDEKSENDKNLTQTTSGALSLLGSVYGSGDDEDVAIDDVSESKENESRKTVHATVSSVGHGSQETKISDEAYDKDEAFPKHSSSHKETIQVLSKNSLMKVSKAGIPNSKKKEGHLNLPSATVSKPLSSASVNASMVEPGILEPPSDIKRLVDRVVEFILKNGPQFEAVLTEQDSKYGRFPFLVPSNQFHPYYANVLQKAQESKSSGKSFLSGKNELTVSRLEKNLSLGKESDSLSLEQARSDIPYDYDRKEKFKMILGKSKKDSDDPHSRISPSPYGITIDAAQTAAILRAATRGVKNSNFGSFPNLSLNGEIKESEKKDQSVAVAANEADSTDGDMTKEQKVKAERLKRAKLFVSILKNGAAPSTKSETPRGLSMEPQEPVVSVREREGRSVSLDIETSVKKDESERKLSDSEILERISRRKYRSRSCRYEDDEEEENEDEGGKKNNEKRSRKKHRSHRSSRENGKEVEDDEEDRDYMAGKRKHRSHRSSLENGTKEEDDEEEDGDYRHGKRKHRSHRSSRENGKEVEDDEEDRDYRDRKRKHRSRRSSSENGAEEEDEDDDEDGRDYRHGKRKHRSHRSLRENGKEQEDDEEDRDQRHRKRKHRSHHSSHENDMEEESDEDDRDYRNGKRRHQSHCSPREDEIEDDNRIYQKSKKHRYHYSSDDDGGEDDYLENSKKKHKSHHSSRHGRDRHKHKERHSSSKHSESLNGRKHEKLSNDEGHPNCSSEKHRDISRSVEDLEEGEISSKISDRSRGSVGAGASREASIDVSSSYRDGRAPSQSSEATEVPDDLRAKIRAMLMANL